MSPFLLDGASQFRAEPPPALTSHGYAKDLNETEAYGALNSAVRTPEQTAIAFFWVGNNINQYNEAMQGVVAQHSMDLVDAAHLLAMGNIVTTEQMGQGRELLGPGEFFQHAAQVDHAVGACDRGQWWVVRPQEGQPAEDMGIAVQLIERPNRRILSAEIGQKESDGSAVGGDG